MSLTVQCLSMILLPHVQGVKSVRTYGPLNAAKQRLIDTAQGNSADAAADTLLNQPTGTVKVYTLFMM
jgi:hypothetical protein